MPKFFVKEKQLDISNKEIKVIEDVNHIKNVLRMKKGDCIKVCVEETSENFNCEITDLTQDEVVCKIKEKLKSDVESDIKITIYQGLPKAEKMELIIQKSVEIGVCEITPVVMDRCVVKLNEKDAAKKQERWQKISEVAAKQSGRDYIPQINKVKKLKDIVENFKEYDIILLAYENEKQTTLKDVLRNEKNRDAKKIAIIVGPEGGISEKEIDFLKQFNVNTITLGNRILRTETVALVMSGIIIYDLED